MNISDIPASNYEKLFARAMLPLTKRNSNSILVPKSWSQLVSFLSISGNSDTELEKKSEEDSEPQPLIPQFHNSEWITFAWKFYSLNIVRNIDSCVNFSFLHLRSLQIGGLLPWGLAPELFHELTLRRIIAPLASPRLCPCQHPAGQRSLLWVSHFTSFSAITYFETISSFVSALLALLVAVTVRKRCR